MQDDPHSNRANSEAIRMRIRTCRPLALRRWAVLFGPSTRPRRRRSRRPQRSLTRMTSRRSCLRSCRQHGDTRHSSISSRSGEYRASTLGRRWPAIRPGKARRTRLLDCRRLRNGDHPLLLSRLDLRRRARHPVTRPNFSPKEVVWQSCRPRYAASLLQSNVRGSAAREQHRALTRLARAGGGAVHRLRRATSLACSGKR